MEKSSNEPSHQKSSQMARKIYVIDYENRDEVDSSDKSK